MQNQQRDAPGDCVAIILAAGDGSRYGSNKIIDAELADEPIGLHTAQRYRDVLPTYIVTRAEDDPARAMFEGAGYKTIPAKNAALGMGNSVAAGGVAAIAGTNATSCLIGLGDMPLVSSATIRLLRDKLLEGHALVRPRYKGREGNPVGLPASLL